MNPREKYLRSEIAGFLRSVRFHWRSPEGTPQYYAEYATLAAHYAECISMKMRMHIIDILDRLLFTREPSWEGGYDHDTLVRCFWSAQAQLDQRLAKELTDENGFDDPEWDLSCIS